MLRARALPVPLARSWESASRHQAVPAAAPAPAVAAGAGAGAVADDGELAEMRTRLAALEGV